MASVAMTLMSSVMGGGVAAGAAGSIGSSVLGSVGSSFFSTIIQGGMTLFSINSQLNAAEEERQAFIADAEDAQDEIPLESIAGIERRASLKQAAHEAVGQQTVAFAASGIDLTFGSPVQARKEAFSSLDRSLESDNLTETTRVNRLKERSRESYKKARGAKRKGQANAVATGGKFLLGALARG